ncbi:MAG TPA: NAD-dependent epimerase/dehydratase family protein [Patescibacteria group bacterium]|nr:NAD-dependent epimerase/dehydratase family protein [Patescibacteria group bacterium]
MRKTRLFLTGGNGFIGKNIQELLGEKYVIYAPSHRQLELGNEKEVARYMRDHPVDVVVHTANVGGNRAQEHIPNVAIYNLRIFFNLVQNSRYFKKFIYLGSGIQYGRQEPLRKVKETDLGKRIPNDEFGFYKYKCARYVEDSQLPLLNLVLFGIYGKYESYQFRFISNALCRALFDMPITISQNARFDYLWIKDFVRILDYFISHTPKYRTYNIGTGRPVDLFSVAKKVIAISGKDLTIEVGKPGFKEEYTCNNRRLMDELPGFRFTPLNETIRVLYRYYMTNKRAIEKAELA